MSQKVQDYQRKMKAFHDSHGGMLQVRVLRREHVPAMFQAGGDGDPDAMVVLESISKWLREAARRAKPNRFFVHEL